MGAIGNSVHVRNSQGIKFRPQNGGGLEFLVTQFGDLMKPMPQFHNLRDVLFDG